MKMRLIEFEGTPAEFELVKHQFGVTSGSFEVQKPQPAVTGEAGPKPALSPEERHEIFVLALTRIPLESRMRAMLKALLKSQNGVTTAEFAKMLGITRSQLAGVFGAFGRRLSHTEGFPEGETQESWLATSTWNGKERRYVLTSHGRAALQDKRVIL
jgi:hypothetical protein